MLLSVVTACTEEPSGRIIAEAYGEALYLHDIEQALGPDMSYEDSVFVVREYINTWVAQQVVLHESLTVLDEQERNKEDELKAYKDDLLVYETLNKLAIQRADSNFNKDELMQYYQDNLQEFILSENIIKLNFIQLPLNYVSIEDLWTEFKSSDVDLEKLSELARENGGNYFIDSSSWVYFDDILKEIPINTYNQEHFLNNNKNIRINEGRSVYFIKILDFRIKSGNSPFEMEKERIKKILTVKRQQAYFKEVETELVEKAYSSNKVIIH